MGFWNYRIVRTDEKIGDEIETSYAIHECFYDDDNLPKGVTENPITVISENVEDLPQILEWMKLALSKPVLMVRDREIVEVPETETDEKPA